MKNMIEVQNLTKTYKDFKALDGVSLSIQQGDIYGLVGENGSGKSTLFKILMGLAFASGGEINIMDATTPVALNATRQRIGSLIERPGYYSQLTVEQNLNAFCIQKGVPGNAKITELLKLVHLYDQKDKYCGKLSVGLRQRYGLALALLGEPEILILDEPINGIDPAGIIDIRHILESINQEKNVTILLSSHILNELQYLATRYGFLSHGKLIEQISAVDLQKKCKHYIDIEVSEIEKYTALLEKELHFYDFKVVSNRGVYIYNQGKPVELFSNLASKYGLTIYKLESKQILLEDYYVQLMEKEQKNG